MNEIERQPVPEIPQVLAPFRARLEAIFGVETADQILMSMATPKRVGFFVNPLRGIPLRGNDGDVPGVALTGLSGCRWVPAEDREALKQGLDKDTEYIEKVAKSIR